MLLAAGGEAELESLCTGETVSVRGPGAVGVPKLADRFDYCEYKLSAVSAECNRLDAVGRWRGVYSLIQRGQPPYRWQNELPLPGIQLDAPTGNLTVEPGGGFSGGMALCVSVADQDGNTERQSLTVTRRDLTILNSHFLPDAVVGVPYKTQCQVAGNSSPAMGRLDSLGRSSYRSARPARPRLDISVTGYTTSKLNSGGWREFRGCVACHRN